MPHVIVQYHRLVDQEVLEKIKEAVRAKAAAELSVPERPLAETDFSFMFFRAAMGINPRDELIADVQVIILAHADEERVRNSDRIAQSIGEAIESSIKNDSRHGEVSYSVSLFLGEMGYHAGFAHED